jgi:hypothetical protein
MATKGHRPGGGIRSRVNVETKVRTGQQKKRVIPAGPAQLGQRQGNHVTETGGRLPYGGVDLFAGTGFKSELGNAKALDVGKGGPGTGRKVYGCGTQGVQGAPAQGNAPPKGELFPGWGPAKK